jgi:hypothetical protein
MFSTQDLARYRMDDRLREAEAYRRSKASLAGRTAEHRDRFRRIGTAAATMLLWPVKH